jgi:thiol-disulfide isomerase/thioredoxin
MSHPKQYASYKSLAPKDDTPKYKCVEIEDLQHRKKCLAENNILCIYLWAKWCQPCKIVAPQFADLAHQYNNPGKCLLVKEDVDFELTRDYPITGIPAFIFYVKGKLLCDRDKNNNPVPIAIVGGDLKQVQIVLDKLIGQGK